MNRQKKLGLARAAVEAALLLFEEDDTSSSDSDDNVEILVMKMYLKYKAKRRKRLKYSSVLPTEVSEEQSKSSDQVTNENISYEEESDRPSSHSVDDQNIITTDIAGCDTGKEVDECTSAKTTMQLTVGTSTKKAPSLVETPFHLHVSHIPAFIPHSLASKVLTDEDFKKHFKISRSSVEELVRAIKNNRTAACSGRPTMPPEKSVLVFLWFLGTSESYTTIGERFKIPKSVAYSAFSSICQSVSALKEMVIQWPTGDAAQEVIQGFETNTSGYFPRVIGSLGATHISISEPKDPSFTNRSLCNSVILQAVSDASGAFIDVFTGWPGSASHAHVWLYSPLYSELDVNPDFLPSNSHLVANESYPLCEKLMVPFSNADASSQVEIHFNEALESKRVIIDHAFSLLKHRFERLNFLHVHIVENIKYITLAACVCHNIAIREAQDSLIDEEEEVQLDEGLSVPQRDDEEEFVVSVEAMEKRTQLAEQMYTSYNT